MTKDSNGEPDALPDDLRGFLDAERDLDAPAAETCDRLFTRLAPALLPPSGDVAGAGDTDAGAVTSGTAVKAGLGARLLVPALCTALGAAGGAAAHTYLAGHRVDVPAVQAPSAQAGGSLRAERLLLESATAALMRGDTASAMSTLQKHAQQYPHGALTEEREVLLVKVLRAHGDEKAAEREARRGFFR